MAFYLSVLVNNPPRVDEMLLYTSYFALSLVEVKFSKLGLSELFAVIRNWVDDGYKNEANSEVRGCTGKIL